MASSLVLPAANFITCDEYGVENVRVVGLVNFTLKVLLNRLFNNVLQAYKRDGFCVGFPSFLCVGLSKK
jgi:hypothetical protein